MKILISGGSGFIGRNLVHHLVKKKYDIMLIGRNFKFLKSNNVKKQHLDLNKTNNNFKKIEKYNPDIFIHLAWQGIPDYSESLSKKNYVNTINIIKKLVKYTDVTKIISTGSCWEYDDGNFIGKCSENSIISPKKPFGIYKHKIFKEVTKIAKKNNIIFNWLRLFYIYGNGQKKNSIIPLLIQNFKNKNDIKINYPANKNDYIFIDDVVKIIEGFISNQIISGIYNVGSGKGTEVKKLMKIIDTKINGNHTITKNYLNQIDRK